MGKCEGLGTRSVKYCGLLLQLNYLYQNKKLVFLEITETIIHEITSTRSLQNTKYY